MADIKLADIGSTNENLASPDGTTNNLRIQKRHQILMFSPLRKESILVWSKEIFTWAINLRL